MEKKIVTLIEEYKAGELPEEYRELVEAAKNATHTSYAPYSHFHVGAAIRLANGEIIAGSNQENAAFSATNCAERSAAFYAASKYPGVAFKQIAVAAHTFLHHPEGTPWDACYQAKPISPCGVCRQALLEYEALYGPIEVILFGLDSTYVLPSVKSLLPLSFTEF